MWISPEFQLLIVKEFQRLKDQETKQISAQWDFRRFLTKVNYKIQTDAIKDVLIPISNTKERLIKLREVAITQLKSLRSIKYTFPIESPHVIPVASEESFDAALIKGLMSVSSLKKDQE